MWLIFYDNLNLKMVNQAELGQNCECILGTGQGYSTRMNS